MTVSIFPLPYSVQFFPASGDWWLNIPAEQRTANTTTPSRYHRLGPGTYRIQWSWQSATQARLATNLNSQGFQYWEWMSAGNSRMIDISVPPGGEIRVGIYANPSSLNVDTDRAVMWVYPLPTYRP